MSDQPTHFLISAQMLQGLMAYLGRRPYGEVGQAMQALERLEPAPPQPSDQAELGRKPVREPAASRGISDAAGGEK
jgi:hypothetical protein